jgi:hypothetical protein
MLKKNKFALRTLIAGFILHFILGTFHLWQTLLRYFNFSKNKIKYIKKLINQK